MVNMDIPDQHHNDAHQFHLPFPSKRLPNPLNVAPEAEISHRHSIDPSIITLCQQFLIIFVIKELYQNFHGHVTVEASQSFANSR
jgi:hypothetical protein